MTVLQPENAVEPAPVVALTTPVVQAPIAVTDAKAVKSVIEGFREKSWAKDVKKYYSGFDVAVSVELG